MKRMGAIILSTILFLYQMPTAQAVGTSASSAVLMDAESGRVLYEHNSHDPRLIASITKLMTALVALESGLDLEQTVTVPRQAVGIEGSSIYLQEGEETTLETLLYGMMLKSGNDAALAIAILCGGTVEAFVAEMNEKAQELGMENSHFENPNGLDGETHFSTAYDMALLARACLENKTLAKIVSTKNIVFGQRSFSNHNKLLWRYEGCVGMKTGFTKKAGRTLVSAAERNGMTLIAVTLNDPNDWKDHEDLLNWGFDHYTPVTLAQEDVVIHRLPVLGSLTPFIGVAAKDDFSYPVSAEDKLELEIDWHNGHLTAPVVQGSVLGCLRIQCNQQLVAEIPLVASEAVASDHAEDKGWLGRIFDFNC